MVYMVGEEGYCGDMEACWGETEEVNRGEQTKFSVSPRHAL